MLHQRTSIHQVFSILHICFHPSTKTILNKSYVKFTLNVVLCDYEFFIFECCNNFAFSISYKDIFWLFTMVQLSTNCKKNYKMYTQILYLFCLHFLERVRFYSPKGKELSNKNIILYSNGECLKGILLSDWFIVILWSNKQCLGVYLWHIQVCKQITWSCIVIAPVGYMGTHIHRVQNLNYAIIFWLNINTSNLFLYFY